MSKKYSNEISESINEVAKYWNNSVIPIVDMGDIDKLFDEELRKVDVNAKILKLY